ncbi:MAG: AAA family ATPase [Methanomassiliicoccales archaeon]|jgi:CO dehydrogenase maturation factor
MTYIVAVAGKGGVGKSTVSALLVAALAERAGDVVLAIDADPNANLGEKLGVKVERTIGDLREDLLKKADELPAGTSKHELVRYQMQLAKVEGSEFDLLTMGRPEGPGCYCYINNILRTFIDEAIDAYPFVVIDNEAGMEHLSRRTTKRMDALIMVSDPTRIGIETAKRISGLADGMGIKVGKRYLVINRVKGELSDELKAQIDPSVTVIRLPEDAEVSRLNATGSPLSSVPGSSELREKVRELANNLR